jgi:hypothetical protein
MIESKQIGGQIVAVAKSLTRARSLTVIRSANREQLIRRSAAE